MIFEPGREAYRKIKEVRKQEENADDGEDAEEDATHRRFASCAGVYFAPSIATESWESHETT